MFSVSLNASVAVCMVRIDFFHSDSLVTNVYSHKKAPSAERDACPADGDVTSGDLHAIPIHTGAAAGRSLRLWAVL